MIQVSFHMQPDRLWRKKWLKQPYLDVEDLFYFMIVFQEKLLIRSLPLETWA